MPLLATFQSASNLSATSHRFWKSCCNQCSCHSWSSRLTADPYLTFNYLMRSTTHVNFSSAVAGSIKSFDKLHRGARRSDGSECTLFIHLLHIIFFITVWGGGGGGSIIFIPSASLRRSSSALRFSFSAFFCSIVIYSDCPVYPKRFTDDCLALVLLFPAFWNPYQRRIYLG